MAASGTATAAAAQPRPDGASSTPLPKDYVPRTRPDRSKMGMGGLGLTSGPLTSMTDTPPSTLQRSHLGPNNGGARERRRSGGNRPAANADDWGGEGGDGGIPIVITNQGADFPDFTRSAAGAPDQGWGSSMLAASSPPVKGNTRGGWASGPSAFEVDGRPGTRNGGEGRPSTRSGTSSGTRGQPLPLAHVPALPNQPPAPNSSRRVPAPLGPAPNSGAAASPSTHPSNSTGAATSRSGKAAAAANAAGGGSAGAAAAGAPANGLPPRDGKTHGTSKLSPLSSNAAQPSAAGAAPAAATGSSRKAAVGGDKQQQARKADAAAHRLEDVNPNDSGSLEGLTEFLEGSEPSPRSKPRHGSVGAGAASPQKANGASNKAAKPVSVPLGSLSAIPTPALMAVAASRNTPASTTPTKGAKMKDVSPEAILSIPVGGGKGGKGAQAVESAAPSPEPAPAAAPPAQEAPTSPTRAQRAAARAIDYIIDLAIKQSQVDRIVREAERKAAAAEDEKVELTDEAWEDLRRQQHAAKVGLDDFGGLMRDVAPKLPTGKKSAGVASSSEPKDVPFSPDADDFKYLSTPSKQAPKPVAPHARGAGGAAGSSSAAAVVAVGGMAMSRYNRLV